MPSDEALKAAKECAEEAWDRLIPDEPSGPWMSHAVPTFAEIIDRHMPKHAEPRCVRCGAPYAPEGCCSRRAEGCQGGRGEWQPTDLAALLVEAAEMIDALYRDEPLWPKALDLVARLRRAAEEIGAKE